MAWASLLILIQASIQCGNIISMFIPLAETDHVAQAHINEPCNMEFTSSHCLFFTERQFSYKNLITVLCNTEFSQFIIIDNSTGP